MSRPFTATDAEQVQRSNALGAGAESVPPTRPDDAVDSSAVRWVFAATVAFWIVVVEAGRLFF